MKNATIKVNGMHCRSCEMLIVDSLNDLGIGKVEVSHQKGEVKVEFDESKVTLEQIKDAIKKEGYKIKNER